MKSMLIFNLNNEQDKWQHEKILQATNMASLLNEFDQYLRGIEKHGHKDFKCNEQETVGKVRDALWQMSLDNEIDLNKV